MKKIQLIILVVSAVLLAACSVPGMKTRPTVNGSGVLRSEERPVAGIERIEMRGFGELVISQGERESLTVEGDDNLLYGFITKASGTTLSIYERPTFSFQPRQPIVFHLVVKNLRALELHDFAEVTVKNLEAGTLKISMGEFSELNFENLQTKELRGQINGFSRLTVNGQVSRARVERRENATYRTAGN
jgi:hypothetical protein